MKKSLSSIVVLTMLVMSGCGSSEGSSKDSKGQESVGTIKTKTHEITMPSSTKIERANWTGVVELADGFSITNDNELLSFKMQSPRIENGTAVNHTLFIDADNNPDTGYNNARWQAELGAEYLIEGNTLFRYSGTGWRWTFVSRVDRNVNDHLGADELELEFGIDSIDTTGTIRTTAYLISDDWSVLQRYESVNYTIEGNAQTNNNFTITDDQTTVTFNIQSQRVANGTVTGNSIFIDADNNPTTGYNNARWQAELGAEYLIEGANLFVHSGDGWSWTFVERLNRAINNDTITLTVNKTNINNLAQTFRTTSYLIDNQWNIVQNFDTLSHTNVEVEIEQPIDNGTLSIVHNLNNFIITIENNEINNDSNSEVYIDADNDINTGFRINGVGAEYRVINDVRSRYRMANQTWVEPTTAGIRRVINNNQITITIPRWNTRTRRHISIGATILDNNNNNIHTYAPITYEVTGEDDEVVLSLDNPEFYDFIVHYQGRANWIWFGIDLDNNRFTGVSHRFDSGDELVFGTNNHSEGDTGEYTTIWDRENNTVTFRILRSHVRPTSDDGTIMISGVFEQYYWLNHYEFNVNP